MLGEVESKLEEFYNDLGNKQLQDEVVAAAVKEMAEICYQPFQSGQLPFSCVHHLNLIYNLYF